MLDATQVGIDPTPGPYRRQKVGLRPCRGVTACTFVLVGRRTHFGIYSLLYS